MIIFVRFEQFVFVNSIREIRVIRCLDRAVAGGGACVDHEGRGLARHSEVTGVDTVVLSELDA